MLIEVEVTEVVVRAIPTGGLKLELCIDMGDVDYCVLRAAAPNGDVEALVRDVAHRKLAALIRKGELRE